MADVRFDIPYGAHVGLMALMPFRVGLLRGISFGRAGFPVSARPLLPPFVHRLYCLRTMGVRARGGGWVVGRGAEKGRRASETTPGGISHRAGGRARRPRERFSFTVRKLLL